MILAWRKDRRGLLTEEANFDLDLGLEVEQRLVALVAYITTSHELIARLPRTSDGDRGSWSWSSAEKRTEGQQEECEPHKAGEGGLELHGGESSKWGGAMSWASSIFSGREVRLTAHGQPSDRSRLDFNIL